MPVTLRKQKEHMLWSEKLTVNIVRKNMHQMATQDPSDEPSWKYCLNYDFVCKNRQKNFKNFKIKCKNCYQIFTPNTNLEENIITVYDLAIMRAR